MDDYPINIESEAKATIDDMITQICEISNCHQNDIYSEDKSITIDDNLNRDDKEIPPDFNVQDITDIRELYKYVNSVH